MKASIKYVGIDAHASSCSICVLLEKSTRPYLEQTCPTDGRELLEILSGLSGSVVVALEESTIADWVYRVLLPYVHDVIVTDPRQNKLIARDNNIDDAEAARKLALLLRAGLVNRVHHSALDERMEFKRLVMFYYKQGKDRTRAMLQLKAIYRGYNIPCYGTEIYGIERRQEWLERLPERARYRAAETMAMIDLIGERQEATKNEIALQSRRYREIREFDKLPGIGLIRAATLFAILDTPTRFTSEARLWAYCGLGIVCRSSGGQRTPPHLTRKGNPLLKNVLKSAAVTATSCDNRFCRQYQALLAAGMRPQLAKLTIARAIASTILALWRKGSTYSDNYRSKGARI